MRCPGCDIYSQVGTFPPSLDPMIDDTPNDDPWWCPSCLAARVLGHHDETCRCGGCHPPGKKVAA